MQVTDGPCAVVIRPPRDGHEESVTVQVLGGSIWFPRDATPNSLVSGQYKSFTVEVRLRTLKVGDRMQTCYVPTRLVELK